MAFTQLSDLIIPEVYASYSSVNSPETTAFFQSGIVVRDELLDQKASTGGDKENIPFWNDLDSSNEPNLSNDTANSAVPNKITASKQVARLAYLNQWYSAADLAGEIAGSDPIQRIVNRFGVYWQRQWQRRLISTANGILKDNVTNNSGDMVVNVAAEAIASQTSDTKFNRDVFTETVFTMGDRVSNLTSIGVHSHILQQMVDNDDIIYIPDSQGNLIVPTYMGLRVIVDDGLSVTAGTTDGFKYTSILFGNGAFGYGDGSPRVPVEVTREALQGNGGGVELIGERKTWILHPFGFADVGNPAGQSFTNTELSTGGIWSRVVTRKNVPLGFLVTN